MATSDEIAAQIRQLQAAQQEAAKREAEEEAKRPIGLKDAGAALERADRAAALEQQTRGDNTAQVHALHAAVRAIHAHLARGEKNDEPASNGAEDNE